MAVANPWMVRVPVGEIQQVIHQSTFEAVQQVFELDIVPEAKRLSPVSPTWPSIPASRGEKRIDTGHNRRTIDSSVEDTPEGPQAQLFTQSGYGGYLETGTSRMPARPYLYPAFQKFIGKLGEIISGKLANKAGA